MTSHAIIDSRRQYGKNVLTHKCIGSAHQSIFARLYYPQARRDAHTHAHTRTHTTCSYTPTYAQKRLSVGAIAQPISFNHLHKHENAR
jgi:hypothetical protein